MDIADNSDDPAQAEALVAKYGPAVDFVSDGHMETVDATLADLRKVVWPSRQQLFSESVAVILMVSLSAAAIAAVDRFYRWGASQVFR
jgi:preprotein translocase subunit SecE